jgi:putative ABC transport system permease protein
VPIALFAAFAMRSLRLRRVRATLAGASIALAVFAVVAIRSAGLALIEAQQRTYAATGQPDIVASVHGLTPGLVAALARRDGVLEAESRLIQPSRLTVDGRWRAVRLVGIERFDQLALDRPELVAGRWPERGEVVLDVTARHLLGIEIGTLVAFQANPGDPIHYARVSGFAWVPARPSATLLDQFTAYVPLRTLRQWTGSEAANTLLVRVDNPALAGRVASELQRFLAARQIPSSGWTVRDPDSFLGARELATLLLLLRAFAILGTLTALFIVANTTIGLVTEERPQLGTLRALGTTRSQLVSAYLAPHIVIGTAGSVVGLLAGTAGGYVLTAYLAGLAGLVLPPLRVAPSSVLLALGCGLGIAVAGALGPILHATRTPAAQLLRGDTRAPGDPPRWLTRSTGWLAQRSPILGMSTRDPFRRPLRAALTVLVTAVALAALLASQIVDHSLRAGIAALYDRYRADAWLLTNPPVPPTYAHRLANSPPVRAAEPWVLTSGAIGSVRTDVWGLPAKTSVYQPVILAGQWLDDAPAAYPPRAVITGNLARRLDAQVGDVLPLDLGRQRLPIQVSGIVDDESTYLGATAIGKVFLDRQILTRLLGRDDRAALYALRFWDTVRPSDSLTTVEQYARTLRPLTLLMAEDRAATERVLAVLTILARIVVLVITIATVFGITNALLLDLTERRREFGILRTLGTERATLVLLLAGQTLVIVVFGALLAVPVGFLLAVNILALVSRQLFAIPLALPSTVVLVLIAAAALTTALAVLIPAVLAVRLRPVEVLRYE